MNTREMLLIKMVARLALLGVELGLVAALRVADEETRLRILTLTSSPSTLAVYDWASLGAPRRTDDALARATTIFEDIALLLAELKRVDAQRATVDDWKKAGG